MCFDRQIWHVLCLRRCWYVNRLVRQWRDRLYFFTFHFQRGKEEKKKKQRIAGTESISQQGERLVRLHRFDKVGRAPAATFLLPPSVSSKDIKLVNESSPVSLPPPFFFVLFLEPTATYLTKYLSLWFMSTVYRYRDWRIDFDQFTVVLLNRSKMP
jgi:hypothetical protein